MEEDKAKSEIDWSTLKGSITLLSVCLLAGSALIGSSYYFNDKLSKELNQNKNIFLAVSKKYLDVDQEEKLLQEYYPQFVNLYNNGVIGREKRLNWIEALRQSGEKIKLPLLRYSINSQEDFTPDYSIDRGGFNLYRSSMELSLGLLHEGDLFRLLKQINKTADGAYTISECAFKLTGKDIQFKKNHSNISASCMLHWITIDLSGGQRIEI